MAASTCSKIIRPGSINSDASAFCDWPRSSSPQVRRRSSAAARPAWKAASSACSMLQTAKSWKSSRSDRWLSSVSMDRCFFAIFARIALVVSMFASLRLFLEDHAHVMQPRNEAAPVHLLGAAVAVAETNDVGAMLPQAGPHGKQLRVEHERNVSGLAVAVVAHQDGQLTTGCQGAGAVVDQQAIAFQEGWQRGHA